MGPGGGGGFGGVGGVNLGSSAMAAIRAKQDAAAALGQKAAAQKAAMTKYNPYQAKSYQPQATPQAAPRPGWDPAHPFGNSGADPYEGIRNRAVQDAGNMQSQNIDAITRRYAAMGNLNSGSYVKALQEAGRQAAQQGQDQVANINLAEQQGALPYAQLEQERANQAQQERQFGAQYGLSQAQLSEQSRQFGKELPLKAQQLDLEANQQHLDELANIMNRDLAEEQMSRSGGLLGGGGFLGLGVGGKK